MKKLLPLLAFFALLVTACSKSGSDTDSDEIHVGSVILDQTAVSLSVGSTCQLSAVVVPDDAFDKTVLWRSGNTDVATVDNNGKVTAVNTGNATIIVTSADGGKSAQCLVTVGTDKVAVTGISLDRTAIGVVVGFSEQLVATVLPLTASNKGVVWTSDNTYVATVDGNGNVKGIKEGSANISVKTNDGGKTASCQVSVTKQIVKVTGISLDKTTASVNINKSISLTATVLPSNATNTDVIWSGSNSSVISVSSKGLVLGVGVGTAVVTARTSDGGKTAQCTVTVLPNTISVTKITLNQTTATVHVGKAVSLIATLIPSDATNTNVSWSSSDSNIAKVNYGTVVGVKAGKATITVKTEDGGLAASCEFTVLDNDIPVTGVVLDKETLSMTTGTTAQLVATVSPLAATLKSVSWKSSNTEVVTVDNSGKLSAIKAGTATITVTTDDGNKTAMCKVTVTDAKIAVTGISLNATSYTIKVGESAVVTAAVTPQNATNKGVKWTSTNTAVAAVDASGKITAVAVGSANIVATTDDGGKTATCAVTVVASSVAVTGVTLNYSSVTFMAGNVIQLTATVSPADATNKNVIWKSSNSAIASVDNTGKVTSNDRGIVTITATTADGGKVASCKVDAGDFVIGEQYEIETRKTSEVGRSVTLYPNDPYDDSYRNWSAPNLEWSCSNNNVAQLQTTKGSSATLNCLNYGQVTITATNGTVSRQFELTVLNAEDVYVFGVGIVGTGTTLRAIELKNNQFVSYCNNTSGYCSGIDDACIVGSDTYICATIVKNDGTISHELYKNGVKQNYTTGSDYYHVCSIGSDVFVSGIYEGVPIIWKNGVAHVVLNANNQLNWINGIMASGDYLYICGFLFDKSTDTTSGHVYQVPVTITGTKTHLEEYHLQQNTGMLIDNITCLYTYNNNIYAAGSYTYSGNKYGIWQNGSLLYECTTPGCEFKQMTSTNATNFITCGYYTSGSSRVGAIWENCKKTFDVKDKNGNPLSSVNSICAYGNTCYAVGGQTLWYAGVPITIPYDKTWKGAYKVIVK